MSKITCESLLAFIEAAGKSWGVLISGNGLGYVQYTTAGGGPDEIVFAGDLASEICGGFDDGRLRGLTPTGDPTVTVEDYQRDAAKNLVALRATRALLLRLFNAVANGVAFKEGDCQFGGSPVAGEIMWLPVERIVPADLLDEVRAAVDGRHGPEPTPPLESPLSPFEGLVRDRMSARTREVASDHEVFGRIADLNARYIGAWRTGSRVGRLEMLLEIAAVARMAAEHLGLCNR